MFILVGQYNLNLHSVGNKVNFPIIYFLIFNSAGLTIERKKCAECPAPQQKCHRLAELTNSQAGLIIMGEEGKLKFISLIIILGAKGLIVVKFSIITPYSLHS
jgi:hypothetical protein